MVELVDVDARPSRAGVDHEGILHEREVWGVRSGTVHRFERVRVRLGGGGYDRRSRDGRGDRGRTGRILPVLRPYGYFSLWRVNVF